MNKQIIYNEKKYKRIRKFVIEIDFFSKQRITMGHCKHVALWVYFPGLWIVIFRGFSINVFHVVKKVKHTSVASVNRTFHNGQPIMVVYVMKSCFPFVCRVWAFGFVIWLRVFHFEFSSEISIFVILPFFLFNIFFLSSNLVSRRIRLKPRALKYCLNKETMENKTMSSNLVL